VGESFGVDMDCGAIYFPWRVGLREDCG